MLETCEVWGDEMYERGWQTGMQEVQTEILIRCVRCGLRGDPDDSWRRILGGAIRPDQEEELTDFVRRNPKMSTSRLAHKIMQESEYVYALFWYKDAGRDSG